MGQHHSKKDIRIVYLPLSGTKTLYEQGLTIVHPYFGEVKRFNFMYDRYWNAYPKAIKDKLHILIVDDCGTPPIHELIKDRACDFKLTIFRITDDLKYNTPGALNLGTLVAPTDFVLQLDSDCAVETDMLDRIMNLTPESNHIYKFRRNRITSDPIRKLNNRFLPCANLLHKNVFTTVGGFDEDFTGARSGGYGFFDNWFDHKIIKTEGLFRAVIDGIIITEYLESLVEDHKSTGPLGVGVQRTHNHHAINRQLYRYKQLGIVPNNREILRFVYKKVFTNE